MNSKKIYSLFKNRSLLAATVISSGLYLQPSYAMMGDPLITKFAFEKLEIGSAEHNPKMWEFEFSVAKDINKLIIKSEGESENGETDSENLLLYSRGIEPYWDIQFGLGHDTHETETHNWAVIGLSGMAPYFMETDLYAMVDSDSVIAIRASTEHEFLITQTLHIATEIGGSAYSEDIPKLKLGSGLSSIGLGIRLKYEFSRKFAPYIGVDWHKKFGTTADYSSSDQETNFVAGISFWF